MWMDIIQLSVREGAPSQLYFGNSMAIISQSNTSGSFISEAIKEMDFDTPLELGKFLPPDRQKWYEWLQGLRMGLDVPLIHVTDAPGSNVGNLHWIWHSTATLCTTQPITEATKEEYPCVPHSSYEKGSF